MTERRHKNTMTRITEVITWFIGLGVVGMLIQIGEYKANFKTVCETVAELKKANEVYAAENAMAHISLQREIGDVKQDINKTQQTIAAHTGNAIR